LGTHPGPQAGGKYCEIITHALEFYINNHKLKLHAYVIMPNHIHLIVSGEKLSRVIQSFKMWTAKKILEELKVDKNNRLLNQFKHYKKSYKIKSNYQVWQEGSHPQLIGKNEVLVQKIDYIHYNPVRAGLVEFPEDWKYSSAAFYDDGSGPLVLDTDLL